MIQGELEATPPLTSWACHYMIRVFMLTQSALASAVACRIPPYAIGRRCLTTSMRSCTGTSTPPAHREASRASNNLALRRSSTARSPSARSDFDSNDLNGYEDEADGDFRSRRGSTTSTVTYGPSSVILNDPARARDRAQADAHMHNYIAEQLERVRTERATNGYSGGDEFEAQASE